MTWRALVILAALLAAVGCGPDRRTRLRRLREHNPAVQVAEIARVIREGDRSVLGELIDLMGSNDEGVRFMAAAGVSRLLGRDLGVHFADEAERRLIVADLQQWWLMEPAAGSAATGPASSALKAAPSASRAAGESRP